MHRTKHAQARANQRGIRPNLIDYAIEHGDAVSDRVVLKRDHALRRLEELQAEERLLQEIISKGGLTVVTRDGVVVTTYNGVPKHSH